ncbi:MAG: purine-nucleoside phosphorylase [Erysipelotrichaceae bacterium]|nr:purine-nucleoside phosphorylase [Erysipelotrichaceae bacterium]
MENIYEKCKEAADYIASKIDARDAIGIVLGSGLGDMADMIEDKTEIEYGYIPNFPRTTAPGHKGSLVSGTINGVKVLCMQGRFHFYEGYDMQTITIPVRVMKLLGVKYLILTNAAGGANVSFKPGTLMVIDDYINFQGDSPLRGPNVEEFGPRFPDMTNALSPDLRKIADEAALELNIPIRHGVYMSFRGPQFESPAEVRFAINNGADAVGMSTVPEILVARHCNLPVLAISCITNLGAGLCGYELTHEEVLEVSNRVKGEFIELIRKIIEKM